MTCRTCCGLLTLAAAPLLPGVVSAQESGPVLQPRVPTVHVFAVQGFNSRRDPNGAGALIPLDRSVGNLAAITMQSDKGGACHSSLQAPASEAAFGDSAASAIWRIEVTPVSHTEDEATFDVRWQRRVPRPGRLLQGDSSGERRLTMRDGSRGILDLVQAAPKAQDVCDTFAVALQLGFQSEEADVADAGLAFDLWLVDRSGAGQAVRTRIETGQHREVAYAFRPITLQGASASAKLSVSGSIVGRARKDGLIDVTIDERHAVSVPNGFVSGDGRKRLPMRPGETIEFPLARIVSSKLPPDLQARDFALRVTAERLW